MANEATCCVDTPAGTGGLTVGGNVNVPGIAGGSSAPGGSIVNKVAAALDAAIHGDGSSAYPAVSTNGRADGKVIDFPMVNPYRPLLKTRVPIAGMNAFPRVADIAQFGYSTKTFNNRGNEDASLPADTQSLGFLDPQEYPAGISLPQTRPSNLQLILDAVARTLPATISAVKQQPYYNPAGSAQYGTSGYAATGYPGQAGTQIGAQAGAAVGNLGDTFGQIVAQHPYLILAGGAALVLMFMQPPRRR